MIGVAAGGDGGEAVAEWTLSQLAGSKAALAVARDLYVRICVLVLLCDRVQYSAGQYSQHSLQDTVLGHQAHRGGSREQEPKLSLQHGAVWLSIPCTGVYRQYAGAEPCA